jgi:hypothetical protein
MLRSRFPRSTLLSLNMFDGKIPFVTPLDSTSERRPRYEIHLQARRRPNSGKFKQTVLISLIYLKALREKNRSNKIKTIAKNRDNTFSGTISAFSGSGFT